LIRLPTDKKRATRTIVQTKKFLISKVRVGNVLNYGFGVHYYNPCTGWGYSVGVSYGWISFSFHSSSYGYWGASGYTYGYRHGYSHGYNRRYYNGYRQGYDQGRRAGYQAGKELRNREMFIVTEEEFGINPEHKLAKEFKSFICTYKFQIEKQ